MSGGRVVPLFPRKQLIHKEERLWYNFEMKTKYIYGVVAGVLVIAIAVVLYRFFAPAPVEITVGTSGIMVTDGTSSTGTGSATGSTASSTGLVTTTQDYSNEEFGVDLFRNPQQSRSAWSGSAAISIAIAIR